MSYLEKLLEGVEVRWKSLGDVVDISNVGVDKKSNVNEKKVIAILESILVKIGGGRRELSLVDLLPVQCQVNLVDILEKYQREI